MDIQVVTREEIETMQRHAIEEIGIGQGSLMEASANMVVKNIDLERRNTFAIICGVGDNGTIGLVVARYLLAHEKTVYIFILGDVKEAPPIFISNLEILKRLEAKISYLDTLGDFSDFEGNLRKVNTIVDAITGIEYKGPFEGVYDFVIDKINSSRIYTLSIDLPSGLNPDTGYIDSSCVKPDLIVCFQYMKRGLIKTDRLKGVHVVVENIGIPPQSVKKALVQRPKF